MILPIMILPFPKVFLSEEVRLCPKSRKRRFWQNRSLTSKIKNPCSAIDIPKAKRLQIASTLCLSKYFPRSRPGTICKPFLLNPEGVEDAEEDVGHAGVAVAPILAVLHT